MMENKTNDKDVYVNEWTSYVGRISTIALCPDNKLSEAIMHHVESLKRLIPQVADSKGLK